MHEISEQLIAAAAAGSREAFEEIYRHVSGFVYNVALRVVRNGHDAEEITQDVFLKLHRQLAHFRGEAAFKSWVYRITVNAALDACRKSKRRRQPDISGDGDPVVAAAPKADVRAMQAEAKVRLDKMLETLNPKQRACVVMCEIEGLSYKEIAAALGVPVNTVRSNLRRAREALSKCARTEMT